MKKNWYIATCVIQFSPIWQFTDELAKSEMDIVPNNIGLRSDEAFFSITVEKMLPALQQENEWCQKIKQANTLLIVFYLFIVELENIEKNLKENTDKTGCCC